MQKQHRNERRFKNVRGLYVHVPFCTGKCFYCAFYSLPYESRSAGKYLQALQAELKQYPRLNPETIYCGGGTPPVLSAPELQKLCGLIKKTTDLTNLKEWTVEANPDSLSAEKTAILAKAGVNRISLGAQSFDNRVLKWLGRRHCAGDITAAARLIRRMGFDNFGFDLIACVPGFDAAVWKNTLKSALKLNPAHISVYALTGEEGSRLAQALAAVTPPKLLSENEELEALDVAENILAKEGYRRYEISNYARPGHECRHNLACWRGAEYIGLGPAAASHVGLKRWTNAPDLGKYCSALRHGKKPPRTLDHLDRKLKQMEMIVFGLRLAEGISETIVQPCRKALSELQEQGLVRLKTGRWRLSKRGKNLADYVGAELFAAASKSDGNAARSAFQR